MPNPRAECSRSRAVLCSAFTAMSISMGLSTAMSLVGVAPAAANPEVRLEWIQKGDDIISPPSTSVTVTEADIAAEVELVLQISLVLDEVAIHEFGFRVIFDDDENDELDFYDGEGPQPPSSYGPFDVVAVQDFTVFESDDGRGGFGEIGPYRGCSVGSDCVENTSFSDAAVGDQTIEIDRVSFLPTWTASNDRRDIVIDDVPFKEEFIDEFGVVIDFSEITFGHASVVPEPSSSALTASALLTLAVLVHARSRAVA